MSKYVDKEQLICFTCKHKWVLVSTKKITKEQSMTWILEAMKEHAQIEKGGSE